MHMSYPANSGFLSILAQITVGIVHISDQLSKGEEKMCVGLSTFNCYHNSYMYYTELKTCGHQSKLCL